MSNCSKNLNGSGIKIRLKEEGEYGLSEVTGFSEIYVKSDSIKFNQNQIESELISGGREELKSSIGNVEVAGGVEVAVDDNQFGFWLKMLLGKVVSSDLGTGKFLHTFNIDNDCIPSFQREKTLAQGGINYLATGLKCDKLSLDLGGEGEILGSVDVIGKTENLKLTSVDTNEVGLASDSNVNSKTLTVSDGSLFKKGDSLTLSIETYQLTSSISEKGSRSIEVVSSTGLSVGDFILIDTISYQILNISGGIILLNRGLEKDTVSDFFISKEVSLGKITNIVGNDVSFEIGLKENIVVGDVYLKSGSTSTVINGETFMIKDFKITSTNGEEITSTVKTLKFDFENNSEGIRLLKDSGAVGSIIEGMAKIKLELTLLFNVSSAFFIEQAKNGKEFDLELNFINKNGNLLTFKFPKGTINPVSPEVSGPGAIELSVEYKPFKTETTSSMTVYLTNEVETY